VSAWSFRCMIYDEDETRRAPADSLAWTSTYLAERHITNPRQHTETRPSFTQVLFLDAFLMFYQLFTLYIAYLADPLPVGSADKLLEPPKKLIRSSRRSRRKLSAAGRREDRAGLGLGLDVSERDGSGEIDLGKDDDDDDDENGDGGGVGDDLDLDMEDDYDYERRALLRQGEPSSPSLQRSKNIMNLDRPPTIASYNISHHPFQLISLVTLTYPPTQKQLQEPHPIHSHTRHLVPHL
jgi:hypothetical protein